MYNLLRFSQRIKKSVTKVININLRKHTNENSASTNEKNTH